jgi:hypothetical protein
MSGPKLNKPPVFTGKDLSLATVNAWVFKIRSYVRDAETDERKVEIASSFLTETYPPVAARFTRETEINVWGRGSVSHHGKRIHA